MQHFVDCPDSQNDEWLDVGNWGISLVNKRNAELALPYARSVDTTRVYVGWMLNSVTLLNLIIFPPLYICGDTGFR